MPHRQRRIAQQQRETRQATPRQGPHQPSGGTEATGLSSLSGAVGCRCPGELLVVGISTFLDSLPLILPLLLLMYLPPFMFYSCTIDISTAVSLLRTHAARPISCHAGSLCVCGSLSTAFLSRLSQLREERSRRVLRVRLLRRFVVAASPHTRVSCGSCCSTSDARKRSAWECVPIGKAWYRYAQDFLAACCRPVLGAPRWLQLVKVGSVEGSQINGGHRF